jgi:hypothetical protein
MAEHEKMSDVPSLRLERMADEGACREGLRCFYSIFGMSASLTYANAEIAARAIPTEFLEWASRTFISSMTLPWDDRSPRERDRLRERFMGVKARLRNEETLLYRQVSDRIRMDLTPMTKVDINKIHARAIARAIRKARRLGFR